MDVVKLSYDFIGLSGTIIRDSNVEELIEWLRLIVPFEVTKENYWVAVGALISRKIVTHVVFNRLFSEVESSAKYYTLVPESLGGSAAEIDFRRALDESYSVVTKEIIALSKKYLKKGEKVFLVAKDAKNQDVIAKALNRYTVFKITNAEQLTLSPGDDTDIDVVITTVKHCEGYTLSLLHIGITGCWFSNQSARDQLEGRLNRLNQQSPTIDWITVHSGILTYVLEKYETTRTLAEALRGFAKDINIAISELKGLL